MKCLVDWTTCDGKSTAHDKPTPAIAYAVLTIGPHVKKYPICANHMSTLMKHVVHHDPHCTHIANSTPHWTIMGLDEA